jgi:hypothetical protein
MHDMVAVLVAPAAMIVFFLQRLRCVVGEQQASNLRETEKREK